MKQELATKNPSIYQLTSIAAQMSERIARAIYTLHCAGVISSATLVSANQYIKEYGYEALIEGTVIINDVVAYDKPACVAAIFTIATEQVTRKHITSTIWQEIGTEKLIDVLASGIVSDIGRGVAISHKDGGKCDHC